MGIYIKGWDIYPSDVLRCGAVFEAQSVDLHPAYARREPAVPALGPETFPGSPPAGASSGVSPKGE